MSQDLHLQLPIETINSKPPYLVDMVSDFGPFVFTSVFIVLMNVN